MAAATGLALSLFALSFWVMHEATWLPEEACDACLEMVAAGFQVASAVICIAVALRALAARLTRRASTPLPPPPADSLATYREAPVECPRHPFAR